MITFDALMALVEDAAESVLFDPGYEAQTGPIPHVGRAGVSLELAKSLALAALRIVRDDPQNIRRGLAGHDSVKYYLPDEVADVVGWCVEEALLARSVHRS